jgi:hypothetical protein
VAGEDAVGLVDQDRVGLSKLDHRRRNPHDLIVAMGARVTVIGAQPLDRPKLDAIGERDQAGG